MRCFDSHAHLDMVRGGDAALERVLDGAFSSGLKGIVTIAGATRQAGYDETFEIVKRDHRIWVAAGIHPHAASGATPDAVDKLRFVMDRDRVVALGEIGLDYFYNYSEPAQQRRAFITQLKMAHEIARPVVIHTRDADEDTLSIMRDEGAVELGGVIHCFSSGAELARGAVEMGFHISFSGIVTFPKAEEVARVASEIPPDRILAETDSPFLSPVPYRGKVNEPKRVVHVVEKLAELRGIDPEEMGEITIRNTVDCFGMTLEE